MAIVRHIGPASAFKVALVVYGVLGLIAGVFCSAIAFAAVPFGLHARLPFLHGFGLLLPIVLCPMLYGIVGGSVAVIGAFIYNLASSWVGGLEVDVN